MKIIYPLLTLMLLSGCATTDMSAQLNRGMGKIPTTQYSNAQTVEEIRNLRPQAELPLKVAVMLPRRWQSISFEERELIENWGDKLKKTGFIDSLEIIPRSLTPTCNYKNSSDCFLRESRKAGARLGADALLFLNDSTVTDSYVNGASILNLTIIGMWFIPAHHKDSFSVYEASLFDIDNGYLYSVVEGRGKSESLDPFMYSHYSDGQKEARLKALNQVGEKLLLSAQETMKKLVSPQK